MQSCWDSRSCLLEMLQSAEVIATAAPPHAEESIPRSRTLCAVFKMGQINCTREGGG